VNIPASFSSSTRVTWRYTPWLLLALVALAVMLAPLPPPAKSATLTRRLAQASEVHVSASQYQFSPSVIRANPGDRITIELAAADVVHGLYVDGYDLEITADPGQTASLSFIADKPGTFRLRCSVTCGPLHPFMIGKLVIGRNPLLWRGAGFAVLAALVGFWRFRR
jgi:heme/copper-type cytochrome/quinol oxidase subunit 2